MFRTMPCTVRHLLDMENGQFEKKPQFVPTGTRVGPLLAEIEY